MVNSDVVFMGIPKVKRSTSVPPYVCKTEKSES